MHCLAIGLASAVSASASAGVWPASDRVPVFFTGLAGSLCYRIPAIIRTHRGTLLAFAEDRGISCGDDGPDHALVLRRSTDDGATWGPLIVVARGESPCDGCPAAISNPNPVEVQLADGSSAVLLHYDTLNNPRPTAHGLDMQIWSMDDGLTWGNGTSSAAGVIGYPPRPNLGAMVGPSSGIQDARGTVYFTGHFALSYWGRSAEWHSEVADPEIAATVDGMGGAADTAFLYWSHDLGVTWNSSRSIDGLNE